MAFREGEQVYIVENNSHVTPVQIIRKDGEFYTIQFSDCGRINLRESRLFRTKEEALKRIRHAPSRVRHIAGNGYTSPYHYNNSRNPYGI